MRGDKIIVEEHHLMAAEKIVASILPEIQSSDRKYIITVAGESGSGKSETATAIVNVLKEKGINSVMLQQDDYFVYPPKTNDLRRRKDISWVGPKEVRLDLLDSELSEILNGKDIIEKPLVTYEEDKITTENISVKDARVIVADGTYTTLLKNVDRHIFIDLTYVDTRAHRQKRRRHESELDDFVEGVLKIEHNIISAHKNMADIIITKDFDVKKMR